MGLGIEEWSSILAFTLMLFIGDESLRVLLFRLRQGLSVCW